MISIKEEEDDNVNCILDNTDGDKIDNDGRPDKIVEASDDFYNNEARGIETEYGNIVPDKEDRFNSILSAEKTLLSHRAPISKAPATNLASNQEINVTIKNLPDSNLGIPNNDSPDVDLNPSEPIGKYQCFLCPLSFDEKMYLSKHLMKHFDRHRPHMCPVCEKNFPKMDGLKTHINCCADILAYQCEECDKAFTTSSKLCQHRRTTHSGMSPYECDKCDYKTFEKNNLNKHLATHMDDRPFKCNYCSYASKSQRCLSLHERIHKNDKRYKCDICYSTFVQSKAFRYHRKTHFWNDLMVHRCRFCPSELGSVNALRKHIEVVHRDLLN